MWVAKVAPEYRGLKYAVGQQIRVLGAVADLGSTATVTKWRHKTDDVPFTVLAVRIKVRAADKRH